LPDGIRWTAATLHKIYPRMATAQTIKSTLSSVNRKCQSEQACKAALPASRACSVMLKVVLALFGRKFADASCPRVVFSFLHAQPRSAALTATIRPGPTCLRLLIHHAHHAKGIRRVARLVMLWAEINQAFLIALGMIRS